MTVSRLLAALSITLVAYQGSLGSQGSQGSQGSGSRAANPANPSNLFNDHCSTCHTGNDPRTPTVAALRQRTPESIVDALTSGAMRQQGSELSAAERRSVAEFLAGRPIAAASAASSTSRCASVPAFDPAAGPQWNGWGVDPANTRFQPAAQAGLTSAQAGKLTLKWAFGFPNANTARAQPTVVGGRLFVGSPNGTVYALDAKTGCTIWTFQAKGGVRGAIVIGPRIGASGSVAYFGDATPSAYAIDASTGMLIWSRRVDEHPSAHVTGTPTLYQDRLYVPVSSGEEGQGGNARYECCTFRGSLLALSAATGDVIWKTYTIAEEAKPIGTNNSGTTRWGPAGAAIWSAPTIDAKRRLVYVATGNMYTEPQQTTSDAVIAFEMESGRIAWSSQVTPSDVFVTGCNAPTAANCPKEVGPDFDFGNSPILATLANGRDLIVIGQKSGIGWAMDPDKKGAVVWQYRAGRGSALGGMEWGSAADNERAYFAVSDTIGSAQPGGLHAVRLEDGQRVWYSPPTSPKCAGGRGCNAALSAAITVTPEVIFAGGNDGGLRAYSTKDGSVIWEFDTNRDFDTVNGVAAHGASINEGGPTVVGGMVYVGSGYGALGGRPGNVLLAFGVE
jgi:polyvinyl alcohol dehydrogenase (cytochrome)